MWLGDDAESRYKVVSFNAGLGHATTGKLILSTQQQMGPFFELGKDKAGKRRGMGSAFHLLWPRYSGTLKPHYIPVAIRLWDIFTFFFLYWKFKDKRAN